MFSGIVEELGIVERAAIGTEGRLEIACSDAVRSATVGDSVAVNGACLTVVATGARTATFDVMPETAGRTTLGGLNPGDAVNLEPAMRLGDRLGGHLVSGHVDGVGTVTEVRDDANARWVTVTAPATVARHLVEKGCVAVDGISLTVVDALDDRFTASLIPHTVAITGAGLWRPGTRVNLEADLVAKYVDRSVRAHVDAVAAAATATATARG